MNIGLFKAQPLLTECVLFVVKILLLIQIYEYRFVYHSADTCSLYIDIYNPYNYPIPQLMHPFSLYICPYIKSILFASILPYFSNNLNIYLYYSVIKPRLRVHLHCSPSSSSTSHFMANLGHRSHRHNRYQKLLWHSINGRHRGRHSSRPRNIYTNISTKPIHP